LQSKLQHLKDNNLYRQHKTISNINDTKIIINNHEVINFSSNDYLSLANDKTIKKALIKGLETNPIGSGASHLITGHYQVHQELEQTLANYVGCENVLLFSTGYMANLAVFSALKNEINWVLQDKLNHASLLDGNDLIGLPIKRYLHNDIDSLNKKIAKQTGLGLIASDVVFSMDGDNAKTTDLLKIKKDNFLLLDDAHGFGVNPQFKKGNHTIYMGTLGKAVGTMGAFVAGSNELIDFIKQKARPYIYTTAISPALCVATLKSLEIIKTGKQQQKLFANIEYFKKIAQSLDLDFLVSNSAIQPLIISSVEKTLSLSKILLEKSFFVSAIRPPTVPNNTSRLRITLCANHTTAQIKTLLTTIKNARII
jgi:8-amino-7-oxononanoate synthase